MARSKEWTKTMRGGQLISRGEIIQLMDGSTVLKCRVLSCLALDDGACYASVEVAEGERKGERIRTRLRASGEKDGKSKGEHE